MLRYAFVALAVSAVGALAGSWDPQLAANYLDSREKEWFEWKVAARDGGPCVSCHTNMTYLMARPALRKRLKQEKPTEYETGLKNALKARVNIIEPPADTKNIDFARQGIATEAILAALFLQDEASWDRLWKLQALDGDAKGSWQWFSLKLDPWEMDHSRFYGAALAAIALDLMPKSYREREDVKPHAAQLNAYLDSNQNGQPLHNRAMLLWTKSAKRDAILKEIWHAQQPDGGWTMDALGPWSAHEGAPASKGSNAYATSLLAVSAQKAGVRSNDERLKKALEWLRANQDRTTGVWTAQSMNKVYKPETMMAKFMQDAATAYAAMALSE